MNESTQVAGTGGTRVDDRRETSAVSANGQTDAANNFLLDGMDNNDRNVGTIIVKPSIDALAEVKIDSSLYPADVGRAGGAVVNMITKSGTNEFHGALFEYVRNDMFDAKDFFNVPQTGNPLAGKQPPFKQNQFGGSLGGPIIKNKTFFFVDYEAFRKIKSLTANTTIPTSCQLGTEACNGIQQVGNFSDITAQIYDPITHAPFTNNVIPLSKISRVGANYAALFPTVPRSSCGATCQFVWSPKESQFAHTMDARIDHRFSDNDTLFFRYSYNTTETNAPSWLPPAKVAGQDIAVTSPLAFLLNFPGIFNQGSQSGALSYTRVFSPTLILQLSAQISRYILDAKGGNDGKALNTAFGGPTGLNTTQAGSSGLALIQFQNGGYVNLGDGFAMP